MTCACAHSMRLLPNYSICLDVLFPNKSRKSQKSMEDAMPFLSDTNDRKLKASFLTYMCFAFCGLTMSLCWGSMSFAVTFWIRIFGESIWPAFILAYNLPGLPILFLQMFTDPSIDKKFQLFNVFLLRNGITLTLLSFMCFAIPILIYLHIQSVMIVAVTFIGILVGAGSGWLFSMGSLFPPRCTSYILIGQGIATLIFLGTTNAFRLSIYLPNNILLYFGIPGIVSTIGLIFFAILMKSNVAQESLSQDIINYSSDKDSIQSDLKDNNTNASSISVLKIIWPTGLSIVLTNFTIVGAVSLITKVPAAHGNPDFTTIILYVSSFATLVGNELGVLLDGTKILSTQVQLLIFTIVRFFMFPLMILYVRFKPFLNDYAFYCFIGVFAMTGSYCNSRCYSLAGKYAGRHLAASASLWMNILLYAGVYIGASVPFWIGYVIGM
eukprot:TRINITY_DN1531_c0_g1_i1.p1 TRINITY_DN1531_c0_g1~~TRINITY_DN1531_c0_g1_i1.p1  ORF type:complete len:439 (-),score=48.24 TRINITY_DN1531_c0_g1_i1:136-1452(-)